MSKRASPTTRVGESDSDDGDDSSGVEVVKSVPARVGRTIGGGQHREDRSAASSSAPPPIEITDPRYLVVKSLLTNPDVNRYLNTYLASLGTTAAADLDGVLPYYCIEIGARMVPPLAIVTETQSVTLGYLAVTAQYVCMTMGHGSLPLHGFMRLIFEKWTPTYTDLCQHICSSDFMPDFVFRALLARRNEQHYDDAHYMHYIAMVVLMEFVHVLMAMAHQDLCTTPAAAPTEPAVVDIVKPDTEHLTDILTGLAGGGSPQNTALCAPWIARYFARASSYSRATRPVLATMPATIGQLIAHDGKDADASL